MPPQRDLPPIIVRHILGRNGVDAPQELADGMATEALNVDFYDGGIGRKRGGASNVTLNGFSGSGGIVSALARYLPSDDETAAELHVVDSGATTTFQRLAAGTTWTTYSLADNIQANPADVSMVNFNGKLYQAYNSAVNRLHVYPNSSGTHRRVGFATPAAPTTATAGGAVTDVRRYAVQWEDQNAPNRRSNIGAKSASVTLTGQQCTVTRPTAPGDGETHWRLYGYTDDDNFTVGRLINTIAIATTTSVDNNTAIAGSAPPEDNANMPPPSAKYLLTDGTHLLGLGAWETTAGDSILPSTRMVWWTPALGTTDNDGDDERVSNTISTKTYLFVDEGITGGGGPLNNALYVFSYRKTYKLIPTGSADNAYERVTLRTDIGCIRHQSIVMAEDEAGDPALYWLSAVGPYRAGGSGIEYIGRDIEDLWATINLEATSAVAWGLFIPGKHQIWWFVATGSNNDPNERWVFDCRLGRVVEFNNLSTVRYGWARHTGVATEARHGCLFSSTLGATMSRALSPYVGRIGTGITGTTIWKEDTGIQDVSTSYQAYVKSKAFAVAPGHYFGMLHDALLLGKAQSGVTITLTVDRDFGQETLTSTAVLTAAGSETRVLPKLEGAMVQQAAFVQFQIGDGSAANNTWSLDALIIPIDRTEEI